MEKIQQETQNSDCSQSITGQYTVWAFGNSGLPFFIQSTVVAKSKPDLILIQTELADPLLICNLSSIFLKNW